MLLDVYHFLRILNLCNDLEIISACIYMLYGVNYSSFRCEETLMEMIVLSVVWCGMLWCGMLWCGVACCGVVCCGVVC